MLLLDELVAATDSSVEASLVVRHDGLFSTSDGRVPAIVGVEYMAQAVAAFAGVRGIASGEDIKLGLLLGTRNFESSAAYFSVGDRLGVNVSLVLESAAGLAVFDCRVTGPNVSVTARLTVLRIESMDELRSMISSDGSAASRGERETES